MARLRDLLVTSTALLIGAGATWVGARGAGPLPPLGPLLDPVHGAWTAVTREDLPREATGAIPGLTAPVDIHYDARSVPHIFATNELDAYRALGYVTARDRLFQIELQTRAGEGTLTELVGPVALEADRQTRRLGMPRAAERRMAAIDTSGPVYAMLRAYADGVNAWRAALAPADYPVEYKLLGAAPREYRPVHALHLFNRMGFTLAHDPIELDLLRARALVGEAAARSLFDIDSPVQEPIQPTGAGAPRELALRIAPPGAPDTAAARLVAALAPGVRTPLDWRGPDAPAAREERAFASNNWAVAPARSTTGRALLAGDPHLELTLPSIWFEVHLVVPGSFDVGGVHIPGLPGVTIGYTRRFAWSFTNTGADVMDFWRETVDDPARPTAYALDGAMVPFVDTRVETYRGKGGETLAVDTVRYTHRGPMTRQGREWLSMRWTVLEAGDELSGFRLAIRAADARGFLDTLARYYRAPAQNMIVADTFGTIMIRSTGRFPIRADSGRGLEVRDGRTRAADWIGDWPVEWYPQAANPPQGFLASANQEPIDPAVPRPYLGSDSHYEIWRALQVNRLLREAPQVSPDRMRAMHTDPGSVRADRLVPYFVAAARARRAAGDTTPALAKAAELLDGWDRRYTRDNTAARLFEVAFGTSRRLTLDELTPAGERAPVALPSEAWQLALLADSANGWWDDRSTPARETRDAILARALTVAYDSLRAQWGEPTAAPWTWGKVAPARVLHLLRLKGFSFDTVAIDGGRGTLNPSAGSSYGSNFGASWRMVAELGSPIRVRAVYPGGQSGNPGSPRYADRLPDWAAGRLDSVRLPETPADLAPSDRRARLTLTPAR